MTVVATLAAVTACRKTDAPPPVPKPLDDMVTIPAGAFRAGCDVTQGCKLLEGGPVQPIHDATLPAFEIDRLEVSVDNYRACWRAGACSDANERLSAIIANLRGDAGATTEPQYAPYPILDIHLFGRKPMWDVSALEARAYCDWVGKRLPTALEWEKAARGIDGRAHPWGNDPPTLARTSNGLWNNWPWSFPLAVGSLPAGASPYGVLDMVGNADEYVERDDGDSSRILVAGGNSLMAEDMRPGLTVLPTMAEARSIYGRNGDYVRGFRCARSVGATNP